MSQAQFVEQIKDMQRQDPVAKEQWYAYCEAYGENVRDPAKHDATYISNFITQYNSGARLEYKEGVLLQQMIKMGQKKSQYWKAVWEQYCQTKLIDGKLAFDPAKHDSSFLEGFFDHIGKQALGMSMMAGDKSRMQMGTGDPMKDQLVLKVKAFQRQGEEAKAAWHTFCDTSAGGVYDPTRHEVNSLTTFVNTNGIQNIDTSGVTVHSASKFLSGRGGGATMSIPGVDPSKMQYVQKIKAYQKLGESQKNAWHAFCDSTLNGKYDPSRADVSALQQFCATYGC